MKRFRNWWQGLSDLGRLQVQIMLLLVAVGLISSLLGIGRNGDLRGFALNFGTEMLGAVVTFWLLGLLLGERQKQAEKEREEQELKARLIRQMGSEVRDVAVPAVEELQARVWGFGEDKSLQGAYLWRANLQGAFLGGVNLKRAILVGANLQEAVLGDANLQGADLCSANLQRAGLVGATFDENTTLPDETKWTPDTDIARFTDPEHSEFWRSDKKWSPAYRGDDDD
jgi:hypothetical protein